MCDTLWRRTPTGAIFAKNSDRPAGELQYIESRGPRPGGGRLATQYRDVADAGSVGLVGGRPSWLWGMEHAVNEHGVMVGNEKLYVRPARNERLARRDGLLGMDVVRLVAERSRDATHGVDIATSLIEEYGQRGVASAADGIGYSSSFLISDATEAYVVETNDDLWVAGRYDAAATISNRIGLGAAEVQRAARSCAGVDPHTWIDPNAVLGRADRRLGCTIPYATDANADPRSAAALLRHHGHGSWGPPPTTFDEDTGEGMTVCMHWKGVTATTSSIIVSQSRDPAARTRVWAAPGAPCVTPFVPIDMRSGPPPACTDPGVLRGFSRRRRSLEHDPACHERFRAEVEAWEARWWVRADEAWGVDGDLRTLTAEIDGALRQLASGTFGTVAP